MSHPSIETMFSLPIPSAAQWFASLTKEQYSHWSAELKKNLGKATLFNDVVFKHIFGEPGHSEEPLKCFINAIREHLKQPAITELTILHSTNFKDEIAKIKEETAKNKEKVARKLLAKGFPISEVVEVSELPTEEVERLAYT